MVEAIKNNVISNVAETQKNPYDFKTPLKILCLIKERECQALESNGASLKRALGMNDVIYRHIGSLEKDGKILRYVKKGKTFLKLTNQGEDTIRKCFLKTCPNYEVNGLLIGFVGYLSSETPQFLKRRKNTDNFVPDRYLASLNEELLEFYENTFKKFCRDIKGLELEVNYNEM